MDGQRKVARGFWAEFGVAVVCLTVSCNSVIAAPAGSWSSAFSDGESSLKAGKPRAAVTSFRAALSLVQRQSKDAGEIDKVKLRLAETLTMTGKLGEARSMLQKMLSSVQATDGEKSKRVRPVLMELGSIEEAAGNHTVAMDYYNRALAITEQNYGPYSPEAAAAFRNIGRVSHKQGNRQAASENYKKAITILSKDPNQDADDALKAITHEYKDLIKNNPSSDQSLLNDFEREILKKDDSTGQPAGWSDTTDTRIKFTGESSTGGASGGAGASQFQQQTEFKLKAQQSAYTGEDEKIALRGLTRPSSDATLRPAFKVLNDTLVEQNRYGVGEEQYQRMIATDINALGPNHPTVGNDLRGLAQLYINNARYADAKPLLVKALAIYEGAYGSKNLVTISTASSLALVEAKLGNREQAINIYGQQLSSAQESLGPGNIETAKILNALAYLYFQQGQLDKSSTVYEWALASTQKAVGDRDPLLAACLRDYAQVLRRLDKDTKASEMEQRAGQISGQ